MMLYFPLWLGNYNDEHLYTITFYEALHPEYSFGVVLEVVLEWWYLVQNA